MTCELVPGRRYSAHDAGGFALFAGDGPAGRVATLNEALQWVGHGRECARAQVIVSVAVAPADPSKLFALENLLTACGASA